MAQPYYETFQNIGNSGIHIAFYTVPGGYRPLHWHEELEILYPLNGASDITLEGVKHSLPKKQLMAVESMRVHSTFCHDQTSMFLCIHIARKHFQDCMPDIEDHYIQCSPDQISDEKFPAYLEICRLLEEITRLYIQNAQGFYLEAEGLTLQVLARLIRDFSVTALPRGKERDRITADRLQDIISYVEAHFREPVTLGVIAERTGLGKEAFCRFFKKNMGMSFLRYVSEVRAAHSYQDLVNTQDPVSVIMENNGFTNQKLFNRIFKELYGVTPSAVRKGTRSQVS